MTATTTPRRPGTGALPGKVWRTRAWSVRVSMRSVAVCGILGMVVLVLATVSISIGDFPLSPSEVWEALVGAGTPRSELVVTTLRLPRVLTAVFSGAALGMSGAIFQSLARNPLGSPDIIGFESGAALGAVAVLLMGHGTSTQAAAGAVAGGLLTALAVYALAWRHGIRTYRLVLVGLGVGFVLAAAVERLMTQANILDVQRATVWLIGSLNGRGWGHVTIAGLSLLILLPFVIVLNKNLVLLELGDDTATALGVRVQRSRLTLAVTGVLLAALAVAAVGPVAFVAFVCGPLARRVVGTSHAAVIPAGFLGAVVMVAADIVARTIIAPTELPVGIATAVIGAPYLLWLLTRQIRTGAM